MILSVLDYRYVYKSKYSSIWYRIVEISVNAKTNMRKVVYDVYTLNADENFTYFRTVTLHDDDIELLHIDFDNMRRW